MLAWNTRQNAQLQIVHITVKKRMEFTISNQKQLLLSYWIIVYLFKKMKKYLLWTKLEHSDHSDATQNTDRFPFCIFGDPTERGKV